jgi:hypothetical protein
MGVQHCEEREHHASTRSTNPPHAKTTPSLGVSISFAPSRRREDRVPPCDLTTAHITSRTSAGECALPPLHQQDIPQTTHGRLPHEPCTACVLRVTAAHAPVERFVHVAALRGALQLKVVWCVVHLNLHVRG